MIPQRFKIGAPDERGKFAGRHARCAFGALSAGNVTGPSCQTRYLLLQCGRQVGAVRAHVAGPIYFHLRSIGYPEPATRTYGRHRLTFYGNATFTFFRAGLFAETSAHRASVMDAPRLEHSLVDMMYEGFYAIFLLNNKTTHRKTTPT